MTDSSGQNDFLAAILARKRREVARRKRRAQLFRSREIDARRGQNAVNALRRGQSEMPQVIAELKFRSPSAGQIRAWKAGEGLRIAQAYAQGGASAISVLADREGFGGSVLEVRRVAHNEELPVLFKEFVIDPVQVELAQYVGASLVLLLVCALSQEQLLELIQTVRDLGMEPVVEAANAAELDRALETDAAIIGINARDLRTFRIDLDAASSLAVRIPDSRVSVLMSGIQDLQSFRRVASLQVDAVLIGEALMKSDDPERLLKSFVTSA